MSSLTPRAGKRLLPPLFLFTLVLFSRAQPIAIVSTNAPLCAGASELALFESGASAVSWHWNGPNGFTSTLQNPIIPNPSISAAGLYSVTITDQGGLTATASSQVAIHEPVSLSCNDHVLVSLDAQGHATLSPQNVLQGNYDVAFYTVEAFNIQGQNLGNQLDCSLIGQSLTYRVTDTCSGNSCWGNLRVEDKMPPFLACEEIFFSCAVADYSPDYLLQNLGIVAGYPQVSDNCGAFTLTYTDQFFNLSCAQPLNGVAVSSAFLRRDWHATDAAGNISTCAQIIYFVRRHLSDVHFPADTTISCQNPSTSTVFTGSPYITEYGHNFTLYPNKAYCEMNAGFSDEIVEICDGSYKILRTWFVGDDCPVSADSTYLIHQQLIKVIDNKGPVFSCPPTVTVSIDPFTCCAITDLPAVILTDNCSRINKIEAIIQTFDIWTNDSSATYGLNGKLTTFPNNNLWTSDTLGDIGLTPCLQQGFHTVTYKALDDCGNASTCSFSLVVEDKTPPVVACDTYTKVALGADSLAEVFALTFDNGSFDNCCPSTFYVQRMDTVCFDSTGFEPSVWFCCEDIGDTVLVAFRAYDCAGNYAECMVQVYVEDKIRPTCMAPKHLTVECAGFDPTLGAYGFAESVDNCCLDTILASVNDNLFDTVCNRGTIIRTFRAFDCAGNSSQCTQRIIVDYKQYYYLKMPDDKIVTTCNGMGNYGEPTLHFEDCELIGLSYEDEVFTIVPEGCYRIDRHWKIINWCTYNPNGACIQIPNPDISQQRPFVLPGPIISPFGTLPPWAPTVILVNPTDPAPTNYGMFWSENVNCYEYKQMILVFDVKDPIIEGCPQSPLQVCDKTSNNAALWNDHSWWDAQTSSHDLCEGPVELSVTAYDACTGAQVRFRYLLFLDLDNNGSMETVINSNNPPPAGMVYFNNALNPNFAGGELRAFDLRAVPTNQKYNFSLQETLVGNKLSAAVRWKTSVQLPSPGNPGLPGILPELPFGRHKIKWLVEDGCTNESFCEYFIDVKDCKAPTVVCLNGLSTNIPVTGTVQLWASDFLQYTDDNCTPTPLLKLGIRKAGSGIGFPLDADGNPITSIAYDCAEMGTQQVELWSMDLAGNADFCEAQVTIQDNLAACGAAVQVSGTLLTESQVGVEAANVEIAGSSNIALSYSFFDGSDGNGQFTFNAIPLPSDYTLTPEKDDNPLNGVTTFDLVEITKHILGLKPLGSPYKMIAADANHSNSVTSFDIIELRKLILGIYTDLPNNTSWRFVDKNYVFPSPNNPFQGPFPENKTVAGLLSSQISEDFVAVKIGDINDSAVPNATGIADNRAALAPAYFTVATATVDQVREGEIIELTIQSAEVMLGFQFTLNFNGLEVLDISPGENMSNEYFALFPAKKALTVAWELGGKAAFTLKCRALQSGYLHQMLSIGSNITTAEAYAAGEETTKRRPMLQFPSPARFQVYPAQPNPFIEKTSISFFLPEAGEATLKLTGENGRVLLVQKKAFPGGFNTFDIDLKDGSTSGVLYYQVETAAGNGAGKMIRAQ